MAFDDDANNDGVDNRLAWLLGAASPNVSALDKLPVVNRSSGNLVMTFDMLPAAVRGGAKLYLEHSGDLGIGDPWASVLLPDTTGGTAPVTYTIVDTNLADPKNPLDVEATISSSEATGGRLFGRLRAER